MEPIKQSLSQLTRYLRNHLLLQIFNWQKSAHLTFQSYLIFLSVSKLSRLKFFLFIIEVMT